MYNKFYQNNINIINTITDSTAKFLAGEDCGYLYYTSFYMYFSKLITVDQYADIFINNFIEQLSASSEILCKFVIIYLEQTYGISVQNIEFYGNNTKYKLAYNDLTTNKMLFFNIYISYYSKIFDELELSKYPIIIDIQPTNTYHIVEGIHRFILCYIKQLEPIVEVANSYYEPYDNIMNKLLLDYETIYKKNHNNLLLYNKIPHFIFNNYKTIRPDRSDIIIDFLKNKKVLTGMEIGPQNGLLTFQLQKHNFNMTAIEYDIGYYKLIDNISQFLDIPIDLIHTNACNYQFNMLQYDFIVSLSVFYHIKRNNKSQFDTLFINLIKNTKILIFDDEPNTQILSIDYINDLLINNNIVYSIHNLYVGDDKRTIYAIINTSNFTV